MRRPLAPESLGQDSPVFQRSIVWLAAMMREVNFLNRRTRELLFLIVLVTQLCGVSAFVYRWREKRFRPSGVLQLYSLLVLALVSYVMFLSVREILLYARISWPLLVGCLVILVLRIRCLCASQDILRLLNETLGVVEQVNAMARHPNIFRPRHLLLLLLGVQNLLRSLHMLIGLRGGFIKGSYTDKVVFMLLMAIMLIFLLQITVNICLVVVLIASYNELHRCTRRISNDLDSLEHRRVLESGQFLVLVKQLQAITWRLIRLRIRIIHLTLRINEHFRVHWLCALIYGLMPLLYLVALDLREFYFLGISALNIIFLCTVFRMLSWESRTTRSFCHFQMSNYHKDFDRTVDVLLHQEIRQHLKVSIYGVTLDTKFLLKLLALCAFWVLVNHQGYLLLHRNIINKFVPATPVSN